MLNEQEISACIDVLIRLGIIENVPSAGREGEWLRMKTPSARVLSRIASDELPTPPEGVEFVPWFSISIVKALLDEEGIVASRDELAALASVIMCFMTEGEAMQALHAGSDGPIRHRPAKRTK